jgi:predicted GNAT family acetyltransferase
LAHILDNPIWNALITGNKNLALGTGDVKYIRRDVGLFAAFETDSKKALNAFAELLPLQSEIVLFVTKEINVPTAWRIEVKRSLLQMVYKQKQTPAHNNSGIVALEDKDIPAMLELTTMTNPGPFLSNTVLFGNYQGIFIGNQLVAMIGQRLQPGNYSEVSAVCTHPAFTRKGFAAKLLASQISKITASSRIPFLHVYPENTGACSLYKKLGFETRIKMIVYFLQR